MGVLSGAEAASLGAIVDAVKADVDGHGLGLYKNLKAKQPDFYNKHFGHFGDDAAITKQGRLTLNYVCDVANDLKAGNDAAGIGKVENLIKDHAGKGRTRDAGDYKLVLDVLVDYLASAAGDKCNDDVKRVFGTVLLDVIKGATGKL